MSVAEVCDWGRLFLADYGGIFRKIFAYFASGSYCASSIVFKFFMEFMFTVDLPPVSCPMIKPFPFPLLMLRFEKMVDSPGWAKFRELTALEAVDLPPPTPLGSCYDCICSCFRLSVLMVCCLLAGGSVDVRMATPPI